MNLIYEKKFIKNKDIRNLVFRKSRGCCSYCGNKLTRSGRNKKTDFCIDHVDPNKKRAINSLSNLLASCGTCNVQKADMNLEEYYVFILSKGLKRPKILGRIGGIATKKKYGGDFYKKAALIRWGAK